MASRRFRARGFVAHLPGATCRSTTGEAARRLPLYISQRHLVFVVSFSVQVAPLSLALFSPRQQQQSCPRSASPRFQRWPSCLNQAPSSQLRPRPRRFRLTRTSRIALLSGKGEFSLTSVFVKPVLTVLGHSDITKRECVRGGESKSDELKVVHLVLYEQSRLTGSSMRPTNPC